MPTVTVSRVAPAKRARWVTPGRGGTHWLAGATAALVVYLLGAALEQDVRGGSGFGGSWSSGNWGGESGWLWVVSLLTLVAVAFASAVLTD